MSEVKNAGAEDDTAGAARRVLRAAATACLATARRTDQGRPYASLVLAAVDHDGTPILLLSDLAEHSRNIAIDDRVSLLVDDTAGLDDPLTGPRLTVLGRAVESTEPRHRARFLARHPSAAAYADFGDFRWLRIAVEGAHFVAGFGRIHRLAASQLLPAVPEALAAAEADILRHMNESHADAVALYASKLLGAEGGGAVLVGVDPEGCDIRVGSRLLRLDFERTIADAEDARAALVALARRTREPATEEN